MIMWIVGPSGAGKSTLAEAVVDMIRRERRLHVAHIDGDVIREVFGNDLGYSDEDRRTNMGRVSRLCAFLDSQGVHAVASVIAPYQETRNWNREHIGSYYEVYIETPLEARAARDPKGLYRKALAGEILLPGVNQPYEPPQRADRTLRNAGTLNGLLAYAPELAALFV